MEKDTYLVNIYLKIHNKKTLTMDDLAYLAKYSPECFEKTCKNVVYNIPEAKPIMESMRSEPAESTKDERKSESVEQQKDSSVKRSEIAVKQPEPSAEQNIDNVLENLKRLEAKEFPVADIDAEEVKSLLGNLFMELLFPHNDKDTFMDMTNNGKHSLFDKKV